MQRVVALLLAGVLALATAVGTVSADTNGNNPPPPCHGQGFPGCSGPGGS